MQGLAFCGGLCHAGVGLAEERLVKRVAETLAGLGHLFLDLLVVFGDMVFNEHVGTVTFLRVAVVDQGVVERIDVARCLPDGGVHEDCRVDAHDILVEQGHGLPPVAFDIVLKFHTVLTVVIDCRKAVVDFT